MKSIVRRFSRPIETIAISTIDGLFTFSPIFISEVSSTGIKRSGTFEIINSHIIAIFSYNKKNYLMLDDTSIELTPEIDLEYYCGEEKEKSWIKILQNSRLICEVEYINDQEPHIDDASGFEDWEVVNFAWHLNNYIQKVKEDPDVVLFPGA
jgi:hypothetical protein